MPGDAQSIQLATTQKHAASITHEVSQPPGAIVTNAGASLRWLARETPNIAEARSAVERIVLAAHRASAVISRTRELYKKRIRKKALLDINRVISDATLRVQREAIRSQMLADMAAPRPLLLRLLPNYSSATLRTRPSR
jgi:C4-dicarboxylate-specific signal transduction histidine kinase